MYMQGSPDKDHHDDDDDGDDDDDDGSQTSFDGPENSQHADIQCPTVTTEALDCPPSHTSKDTNTQVEVPEDAFEARVVVHSALHIEYETVPRNVYVTLHPHRNADRVCTPAVSQDTKPVWDYHCLTHIPNMYLQPQVCFIIYFHKALTIYYKHLHYVSLYVIVLCRTVRLIVVVHVCIVGYTIDTVN